MIVIGIMNPLNSLSSIVGHHDDPDTELRERKKHSRVTAGGKFVGGHQSLAAAGGGCFAEHAKIR
jgi:hypothetical protein